MVDPKTNYGTLVVGDWPSTAAKNASGASAVDGTPYDKNFIDGIWGWQKALMYSAGMTPNGVQEDYNASQLLKAGQRIYGGPGELCLSMLNQTELALRRLMPLAGSVILISSYPDLCAAVYVGDANNATAPAFYKCGSDKTRSTSGLYMTMPDLRGLFPRAMGTSTVNKMIDGSHFYDGGSLPAKIMGDVMLGHGHSLLIDGSSVSGAAAKSLFAGGTSNRAIFASGAGYDYGTLTVGIASNDGTHGNPNIGFETAPASFATQICIRY